MAVCHRLLLRQRWRLGRLAYGRPLGSGHRLEGSHGHRRRQRAVRCRHGLGGRAAGMREDGRGLGVAGLLICERGRRSRGAWRGWKIMDGPVAVLYWLVDGEHPRLSEWGDGGAEQQQQKRLDAGVQRLQDGRGGGDRTSWGF